MLEPFKDNQLEIPGRNVILAINLGVLSNFVESEYGNEFSKLRSYVEDSNILTTQVNNNDFDENGHFQHVSFSDYHMYSLTKDGIHAGYIEDIMKKVFSAVDENRFYQSYIKDCESCPLSKKCPVKMNYEFLMEEKRQVYVSQLLVETIIKDKVILPTLAYLGGELLDSVKKYLKAFETIFTGLSDGENLTTQQENALLLGTIEVGRNTDEILFTPFHPLNLKYQLALLEENGIEYATDIVLDRLNSINLLPYIQRTKRIFKASDQLYSACTSHEYSPSYVLTAMGLDADRISSAIRISWGAHTDKDELINELSELIAVAKSLVF